LQVSVPRLLVAGLRGGGGKTLLSLGLAASFRFRGLTVAPFKKGPDYIDASWLTRAAQAPCRNLDLFLFSASTAVRSFVGASSAADLAIIEGNRGLFDGMDALGTFSSGELAKLLRAPVILSVDVTKTTRTAAAQVLGCQTLDPDVPLAGIVLNRVAGARHEKVLRESMEGICGLPVVGAIPKLPGDIFPERHLGLIPPQETDQVDGPLARVREVAEKYLDLDVILELARAAEPAHVPDAATAGPDAPSLESPVARIGVFRDAAFQLNSLESPVARIGVFRDAAFQFYYPENLEAIVAAGGKIVEISPIEDEELPGVDALYLGGGFPETLAPELSRNTSFMASVRTAAENGLPIYAECGGAVYLGRTLEYGGNTFSLVGVLPVDYGFQSKPKGHGYTALRVIEENPFFPVGSRIRGHEFHYTYMASPGPEDLSFAFEVHRGTGYGGSRDGLCFQNVVAAYTHIHALGTPEWAMGLVETAVRFKSKSSA
jgi:cobyrinic acid a,c-diamide synthase